MNGYKRRGSTLSQHLRNKRAEWQADTLRRCLEESDKKLIEKYRPQLESGVLPRTMIEDAHRNAREASTCSMYEVLKGLAKELDEGGCGDV